MENCWAYPPTPHPCLGIYAMQTENWHEETIKLLKACPREISLAHIALETGLHPNWLSEFNRGTIEDPGVNKVQKLHDYLVKVCAHNV